MRRIDEQLNVELFFEKYKYVSIEELKRQIEATLDMLEGKLVGAASGSISRQKRLKLYKELKKEFNDIFGQVYVSSIKEIEELSTAYVAATGAVLDHKLDTRIVDQIFNIKNDKFLDYTFEETFKLSNRKAVKNIKTVINAGLSDGQNPSTFFNKLKKDIAGLSTAQIKTASRTYAKVIREQITDEYEKEYLLDDDNFIGWNSLATLDSRTSPICISLDGVFYSKKKYKSRDNVPNRPPRHFNCRTVLVRVYDDIKPEYRQSKGDNGGGLVKSKTTFNEFLKRNKETAKKVLGPNRYKLWESGKYDIKDFINSNGEFFTLKELKDIF